MALSLAGLSEWLGAFQAVFGAFGHAQVYVGGSSARALLDGSVAGLRDVDLFLDGEGRPEAELGAIVARLVEERAVRGELRAPREKLRAHPELPLPARERHVIGVGTHLFPRAAPLPIVSLTLLRRREDLQLGGIFNCDAIYVVVDTGRPLLAQVDAWTVIDPFDGVVAWRARRPRVIHWEEVARCHTRHGLRIARTLAGCGCAVDAALVARYRGASPGRPFAEPEEVVRDLIKLLADPTWRGGLARARALGVGTGEPGFEWLVAALERWDPEVEAAGEDVLARARALLGAGQDVLLGRIAGALGSVFPFPEIG